MFQIEKYSFIAVNTLAGTKVRPSTVGERENGAAVRVSPRGEWVDGPSGNLSLWRDGLPGPMLRVSRPGERANGGTVRESRSQDGPLLHRLTGRTSE